MRILHCAALLTLAARLPLAVDPDIEDDRVVKRRGGTCLRPTGNKSHHSHHKLNDRGF